MRKNLFKGIYGLANVKDVLYNTFFFPRLYYEYLYINRITSQTCGSEEFWNTLSIQQYPFPSGILLYGPPGTGKTLLGAQIAKFANLTLLHLDIPSIISAEVGSSEIAIASLFRQAQIEAPVLIFMDEFQVSKREVHSLLDIF